jgi:hypothetical protein
MWKSAIPVGLVACALFFGCGGPTFIVQQYKGPVRERETIAVIRVNGKESIVLVALDGEDIATRVPEDARLHVEVLPGKHTVTIGDLSDTAEPARTASFTAEAGKTYRPVMQAHAARVYEVSPDTDVLLSDVTLVVAPPAEPVPRVESPPAPSPEPTPVAPVTPEDPDAGMTEAGSGAE